MFDEELITTLQDAERITVMTGAGISAESGLPTFRQAQTGLWAEYDPQELATRQAFRQNPQLVWDWYAWRRELAEKADPNSGHRALVRMAANVPHLTLITQNVDGLHQRAGSREVIELHGNLARVKGFDSNRVFDGWRDLSGTPPQHPETGELLRPDVVWFGESLPAKAVRQAVRAAAVCDVYFSIGTSSMVYPAASLVHEAIRNAAVIVEINPNETPLTVMTDYALAGSAGEILPALVESVWGE